LDLFIFFGFDNSKFVVENSTIDSNSHYVGMRKLNKKIYKLIISF